MPSSPHRVPSSTKRTAFPSASHTRLGTEQSPLDSLENKIGQRRSSDRHRFVSAFPSLADLFALVRQVADVPNCDINQLLDHLGSAQQNRRWKFDIQRLCRTHI